MKSIYLYFIFFTGFLAFIMCSSTSMLIPFTSNTSSEYSTDIGVVCACQEPVLKAQDIPVDVNTPIDPKTGYFVLDTAGCGGQHCHSCFVCMGWQLFIAMNWPADPNNPGHPDTSKTAAVFGDPYDNSPLVWETFKTVHQVFNDEKPTAWGTDDGDRYITGVDEKDRTDFEHLQADNTWLMDVNGNMVFYEIAMNEIQFNHILENELYNQQGILKAFKEGSKPGISLPDWSVEVKASWMIVPEGEVSTYRNRYKLTKAKVPDWKNSGEFLDVTLALIGMHLTEKTPKMPNWVWFTFEHVDNCPTPGEIDSNIQTPVQDGNGHPVLDLCGKPVVDNSTLRNSYNLYNPNLPADQCPNYMKPASRDCPGPDTRYKPVQTVRFNPIDDMPAASNVAMQNLIKKSNENSVWQYYQIINAQWPVLPQKPDPLSTRGLPSTEVNPRPDFVANTTMETYMQTVNSGGMATKGALNEPSTITNGKSSCIRCHAFSATTPEWDKDLPGVDRNSDFYWTDYSSVFFKAKMHK